jgi:hypothetical protein
MKQSMTIELLIDVSCEILLYIDDTIKFYHNGDWIMKLDHVRL